MSAIENFIRLHQKKHQLKIGVVGDAMIDEYFSVRVKKISPEFPIPVMHSDKDESDDYPGGAANVAYQFKNFNVKANLIAFTDELAETALSLKGVNTALCLNISTKIPRKRRFYSDDFPTYRWDVEQHNYGLGDDLDKKCLELFEKTISTASTFDVMIFSDYNKGVFSKYLHYLISETPISIVDPKSGDIDRWQGCTVFKPNKQEALSLSGCNTINEAGEYLLNRLHCKSVIITEAGQGVSIFDSQGIYEIRPTEKLPPAESVIGAGDCFTAFLAMSLGNGMDVRSAAEVAWKAGVLYVKSKHNKPLSKWDLIKTVDPALTKLVDSSSQEIMRIFQYPRNYKLVFTNGCFDILHAGHIEMLRYAKAQGDKLVVALNSDQSVAKLKPGRPYVPLKDRMKLLAALEYVDFVVSFEEDTPLELLGKIKPDVLVKGAEYQKEDIVGYGIVKEIITAPMVEGLSTTNIVEKIKAQVNEPLSSWQSSLRSLFLGNGNFDVTDA